MSREANLIPRIIAQFALDLSGLTIITEAASGAYAPNAALAAAAGADVIAIAKPSRFATVSEVITQVGNFAAEAGVSDQIRFVEKLNAEHIASADMITNSGFVRPIGADMIAAMKPTAVVPLMWETWEYRTREVDLDACKKHGILCLGTDESARPLLMDPYAGILAVRNLMDMGLEVYHSRVVLIGQNRFGRRIHDYLNQVGANCIWFSDNPADLGLEESIKPLGDLRAWWSANGNIVDAIMLAELVSADTIIGTNGWITPQEIVDVNPSVKIGLLAGLVEAPALEAAALSYHPKILAPAHYMTAQLYDIGPRPIMELYAAGLKVGELKARARRSGLSVADTAYKVLAHPLAMDFEGDLAWL